MVDLRVNNEALLCMLERERQHSQQLAQALHQVQADALEVTLLHSNARRLLQSSAQSEWQRGFSPACQ